MQFAWTEKENFKAMKQFILIISLLAIYISSFSQNSTSNSNSWNSVFETVQNQPELKVYPNPVKNQKITIEMVNQKLLEIRLTNIAGKEILLKKFDLGVNKHLLQLKNTPKGIYLLQVKTTEDKAVVMKLIISAYIDPNTGGMLFQILAVLFGVISGTLLLFSGKIKGFYYRLRRRRQESDSEPVDENSDLEQNE